MKLSFAKKADQSVAEILAALLDGPKRARELPGVGESFRLAKLRCLREGWIVRGRDSSPTEVVYALTASGTKWAKFFAALLSGADAA